MWRRGEVEVAAAGAHGASCKGCSGLSPLCLLAHFFWLPGGVPGWPRLVEFGPGS